MIFPGHRRGKHFRSHSAVPQLLFVNDVRRFAAGAGGCRQQPKRTLFGRSRSEAMARSRKAIAGVIAGVILGVISGVIGGGDPRAACRVTGG
jgi:hypothetical protein